MALYDIKDIHYMSSGSKRGLLNLDIGLGYQVGVKKNALIDATQTSAIIHETGPYDYVKDTYTTVRKSGVPKAVSISSDATQLLLSEHQRAVDVSSIKDDKLLIELITKDNYENPEYDMSLLSDFTETKTEIYGCTYEYEKQKSDNRQTVFRDSSGNAVLPLNDMLDVTIKSCDMRKAENTRIPKQLDEESDGRNEDITLSLEKKPVQFCGFNGDSFLLTDKTVNQPYYLRTDLDENLKNNVYKEKFTAVLKTEPIKTYLYQTQQDTGEKDYGTYISKHPQVTSVKGMSELFEPKYDLGNVSYNYIVKVNQNDLETKYKNGEIFGDMMTGKNAYNSTYSMDVDDRMSLKGCRTYCGIQNANGRMLLKYYDDVDYTRNEDEVQTVEGVKRIGMKETPARTDKESNTKLYPYQKVEYLIPGSFKSSAKHKSTLFSVKIANSGLETDQGDSVEVETAKENIRRTISNAISEFVENICPANTQLFNVYYK